MSNLSWNTIRKYSRRAGKEVLALAEATYKTMVDPRLSLGHKTLLIGALIYLLSPVDVIPDFLPGGYADDISVMLSALVGAGKIGKHHLQECRLKHGLVVKVEDKN